MKMIIGLVPAKCINNDISFNINQIYKYLEIASNKSIDYIFFGESFLQGFDSLSWSFEIDSQIAVTKDSSIIEEIKSKAKSFSVGIGFGYFELSTDSIYSSYLVLSPHGQEVANYRRISKGWKEFSKTDEHYKEGKGLKHFSITGYDFTLALCGDLWDESSSPIFDNDNVKNTYIIWPVHVDYSRKEWFKEIDEYYKRALYFSNHAFLINNIIEPTACGGAFYFNGTGYKAVEFGKEEILSIKLS
jgi:N-carbamoylputrescine amidase